MTDYRQNWGAISRRAKRRGMTNAEFVRWLIAEYGGLSAAAREAGVARNALYYHLKKEERATHDTNE